jgi:hypothetical protein
MQRPEDDRDSATELLPYLQREAYEVKRRLAWEVYQAKHVVWQTASWVQAKAPMEQARADYRAACQDAYDTARGLAPTAVDDLTSARIAAVMHPDRETARALTAKLAAA